ncbi:MAG: DUF4143 domain-containing protein [Actinomycetia bacterium]|nr:DUF4143 domain-containing protein [Actinomycetes bacterium]
MLGAFGAVEIAGPRWCGKTWTALAAGASVVHVDDPGVTPLVEADPPIALKGEVPHVIDEWQFVPRVWDTVRRTVDASGSRPGQFILTGSSTPRRHEVSHSGAGRIGRLRMRPMTLSESGVSSGVVSLADLFAGGSGFETTPVRTALPHIVEQVCIGGWPALIDADVAHAQLMLAGYWDTLFDLSFPAVGRSGSTARSVALALARNVAQAATHQTLLADVGERIGSTETLSAYLDEFVRMYLIDELPGWDAPIRSASRVRTKPKRYFADPSLVAALLTLNEDSLLRDAQTLGFLFENLCLRDLRAYSSVLPGASSDAVRYYADADNLEVDVIIELRDGRWAGIEIKLSDAKVPQGIDNLLRLKKKIARNPAARNPEPVFLAVVVGVTPFVRRDPDTGVYITPITALTA